MHIEINAIDIEHYNIGILKGQFNMIHVIFSFHNTEGNLQYRDAVCNMNILLHMCIIFQNSYRSYFKIKFAKFFFIFNMRIF